jgi:hypothetical protein
MDTHADSAETDQVQSRAAVTLRVPVPPEAPNETGELVAEIWHLLVVGAVTATDDDVHRDERNAAATPHANAAVREPECMRSTRWTRCMRLANLRLLSPFDRPA